MSNYNITVGRFQTPELTEGHKHLLNSLCKDKDHIIVFIGVNPVGLTKENPLNFELRKKMVDIYLKIRSINYTILPLIDMSTDEAWVNQLELQISSIIGIKDTATIYTGRTSLQGKFIGKYKLIEIDSIESLSGTELRNSIDPNIFKYSRDFKYGACYSLNDQWNRVISTVDIAVMDTTKQYLLLGRKSNERKFRFPGGFCDPSNFSYEEDATRKLKEKTGLLVEPKNLIYLGSTNITDYRYSGVDKIRSILFLTLLDRKQMHNSIASADLSELSIFHIDNLSYNFFVNEHNKLFDLLTNYLK